MPDKRQLILVDGSSYLYRAFHALPPLSSSRGEPTGAVYGVVNMLNKLLREYEPEHIAVVFDAPGKTFRDEIFEEYKANRPPMPDELRAQIEPLIAAVDGLGLPMLRVPGVEADDVIGTLAQRAAAADVDTLISSGDKDLAQLVDEHVTVVDTMFDKVLDREGVRKKFGVEPEQIVDFIALIGDTSDNIPGIPKVGPKTAAKWLNTYGSLDEIVAHAEEIKGKVGENLRAHLDQLELSRRLATIECDVELDVEPLQLERREPDTGSLRELYTRLELRSLQRQLDEPGTAEQPRPEPAASETRYETVTTFEHLDRWLTRLEQAPLFAFDTETTSLDYMQAEIVGLSFAMEEGEAAYVPLAHDYPGAPEQLSRDDVLERFRPLLEDDARPKAGHHLKYDAHVLANHGIVLRGLRFDSMLESYVLDSTATRHDMDSTALHYLGLHTTHYEDIAGRGAKQLRFNEIPIEQAAPYAAEDADITLRLHHELWGRLEEAPELKTLYETIEQPLITVLQKMERRGVLIDQQMLKEQSKQIAHEMHELEQKAHTLAGGPFNVGSPQQLQEILFDRLGLPVKRKTPKGQPSTAEDVLQQLAEDYPLPRVILDHRALAKLKSTYTHKLPTMVDPTTGRVHTSYHQAVAATGRLSSSDPNLQNIPIRTAEGRRIRQAFVAPEGYGLVAADYSQIELRIMAHLSGDDGLLRAFAEDRDIHQATAAEVFGAPPDEVTAEQRRSAKVINFGLIYGMSPYGLARQLGIEQGAARDYVELYFARYPGVKAYMDDTRRHAHERGFVSTVFGRRLYLPDINSRNGQRRQYAERSAINAPMQGTAADIIKRAMISLDQWISEEAPEVHLIMQVHDELVFEVPSGQETEAIEQVRDAMTSAAELSVPLKVDVGTGENWDVAH